ncbi:MAG: tripartite tricarboxylate transporter substrate binding protein [Alcaligenaceae bacterium]
MKTGKLGSLALVVALLGSPSCVAAAEYPADKPIKMVVGFTAGGAADKLARPVADRMAKFLGQTIVMEYRPGVAGGIALELVARAPADGYTIHLTSQGPMTFGPSLRKASFDPVNDFTPIGMVSSGGSLIAVLPTSPAKDVKSFIALAKANPSQWSYGTSGIGGSGHLAAEQFKIETGLQISHVPYKGGAGALTDLLGGHIPVLFSSIGSIATNVEAGQVKALAVSSITRSSMFPDVPTIAESGFPGYDMDTWIAMFVPRQTPDAVVDILYKATIEAVKAPDVQERIKSQAGIVRTGTPAELDALVKTEIVQFTKIVKDSNIKPE